MPATAPLAREALAIEFVNATKVYQAGAHGGAHTGVDDLSLTVPAGEICCLVGPSGGGKTTAMRLVNRLIDLSEGDILVGGRSVSSIDPVLLRRDIGYVIQDVGLFPHLTIARNIAVPLRLHRWPKDRARARVEELLTLVGLDVTMSGRYPAMLSGGQQQRVGLARALAVDPPIMLMDEPFGALDPITRARLQDEFLRLQRELRKTVIFVTHDIDEALKMGDKVAVLREGGRLAQYASPEELLATPADEYVASFIGEDRGLKRLNLHRVRELPMEQPATVDKSLPTVNRDASLRLALSILLESEAPALTVTDAGAVCGRVTLRQVTEALRAPSSEDAGGGAR
ncbi:MAG: ABC transporter ATP-binding protein [Solirubrobacteraceae bacterium]